MYSIGIDYGTLSGRVLLVRLSDGCEVACRVVEYAHGVMDKTLPSGKKLGMDWALQHPQDYLDVLSAIPALLKDAHVSADEVKGVGVDFTACTIMPTKADGTPLCFIPEYADVPHAYVKLWKHHAAQDQANRLNDIAAQRGEKFLSRYGGKISCEWAIPKVMQLVEEAPDVYDKMDRWIEATDWIVWQLTGVETRNCCTAGYKGIWSADEGYPSEQFFAALNPKLRYFVRDKFGTEILPLGTKAGEINASAARLTGLNVGTAVAVGNVDAHVAVPAVGIKGCGKLLMIIGTSTCHILAGEEQSEVPGMCGVVKDGVLRGLYGYEAGQSCVGDHFDWFVKNCVPEEYAAEAKRRGISLHVLLTELAAKLEIGESGLLALDWWNGNRSVLVDVDLTGMMLGMTLQTKPEECYRALIEATAFGTRRIIDAFEQNGVYVDELFAAGGIAEKNTLLMQIYADVTNRPIKISGSPQAPALGAAIFGAYAGGCFDDFGQAVDAMGKVKDIVYKPIEKNVTEYGKLYREYYVLHDYFGHENDVMKRLKKIKAEAKHE